MLSMFDAGIVPLTRALNNLAHILKKGEEYADAKSIEHGVLLNARLFADMYPLTRQVQIATDMSKGAAARLAGLEVPKFDDNEASFADLQARIAKTIAFIESVKPEQLEKQRNTPNYYHYTQSRFTVYWARLSTEMGDAKCIFSRDYGLQHFAS